VRLCGHTMGTPRMDLLQALSFFAEIGCAAIEVRCARDGHLDPERCDSATADRALEAAEKLALTFACLTPYYRNFADGAVREREIAGMKRTLDLAARLRCPLVRAYGGALPPAGKTRDECWQQTVTALQELADYAAEKSVGLAIETHTNTLTFSAGEAAAMAADVARANVGILFDIVWVTVAGRESLADAVQLCAPWIRHVHVKDCTLERPANKPKPCLMGRGEMQLKPLVRELQRIGYSGCLCDEYEKFWHPELPEPQEGMKHNAEFLRAAAAGVFFSPPPL
jgi:sugar phosphate isomerase/epimerase